MNSKVLGIINIQLFRKGILVKDLTFKNLILNTFFERFANGDSMFTTLSCKIGTGTATPTNSDTALQNQIASRTQTASSDSLGAIDVPNNQLVCSANRQFEFVQGSVVGNISEVGFEFSPGSSGLHPNTLQSRSLIKDSFGTPTALTVTADDQLVINYSFRILIPLTDYTGSVELDGVTYSLVGRLANNFNKTVNEFLTIPSVAAFWFSSYGSTSVFGDHGVAPTVPSGTSSSTQTNFFNITGGKEFELAASINQLNASGGIKVITFPIGTSGAGFKYEFTPVIPKTNTKILKLRFRMTCTRA